MCRCEVKYKALMLKLNAQARAVFARAERACDEARQLVIDTSGPTKAPSARATSHPARTRPPAAPAARGGQPATQLMLL